MAWWIWISIGLLLITVELLVPSGFFLFIFGLAAVLVGGLCSLLALEFWQELALFTLSSVALSLYLRRRIAASHNEQESVKDYVEGEQVVILGEVAVGAYGKGELRGAVWTIRNIGAAPILAGSICRVLRRDGLLLEVDGTQ